MDVEDMRKDLQKAVNMLPPQVFTEIRKFAAGNWEVIKNWGPVAAALMGRHIQAAMMLWAIMSEEEKKEIETVMKEVLAPKMGPPPNLVGEVNGCTFQCVIPGCRLDSGHLGDHTANPLVLFDPHPDANEVTQPGKMYPMNQVVMDEIYGSRLQRPDPDTKE